VESLRIKDFINILGDPAICNAIIKSGTKKGQQCGKNCAWNNATTFYCGTHRPAGSHKIKKCSLKQCEIAKLLFKRLDQIDFSSVSSVILEQQPNKNQKMKAVCTALEAYFIIRYQLTHSDVKLTITTLHAKNKLLLYHGAPIQTPLKGYAKRKYLAQRHVEYFLKRAPTVLNSFYFSQKKRDDLADSFLYAISKIKK